MWEELILHFFILWNDYAGQFCLLYLYCWPAIIPRIKEIYKFLSAIAYTFLYIYLEEKIGADA